MATAMLSAFAAQSAAPSGTVPTIYINTANNASVTSKEVYLDATYYLEGNGFEGVESLGSEAQPLPLTIKGRGNYTWTGFDKKPYKLKLDKKTAIMGMGKNKHFALLAHADDDLAFMRNVAGLELSRRMNLAFTPADAPVEVVLNGEYLGLYFLRKQSVSTATAWTLPSRMTMPRRMWTEDGLWKSTITLTILMFPFWKATASV